ncbi:MAG: hypothetical protein HQM10_09400 [Candidatus Riflebacteria bacterium]|nr:hypothetical protein [Candidatus Riflebacteria bacterium]
MKQIWMLVLIVSVLLVPQISFAEERNPFNDRSSVTVDSKLYMKPSIFNFSPVGKNSIPLQPSNAENNDSSRIPNQIPDVYINANSFPSAIRKFINAKPVVVPSGDLVSITLSETSKSLITGKVFNLGNIVVTANFSTGSPSKVLDVKWTKVMGAGTLNGKSYTAPISSGTAVLACSYTKGGITKNAGIYIIISSLDDLRATLNKGPLTKSTILRIIDLFQFSGTGRSTLPEAIQLVKFLGAKNCVSQKDYVTGYFDGGWITMWDNYNGKTDRYCLRFGNKDTKETEVIVNILPLTGIPVGTYETNWKKNLRALVIIIDPILNSKGKKKLHEYYNLYDPEVLAPKFISDIKEATYNQVNFEIAETLHSPEWPAYTNSPPLTEEEFIKYWEGNGKKVGGYYWDLESQRKLSGRNFDYDAILNKFNVKERVESGDVDEVWLFGYPWMGTYETRMVGSGSIWCNGPVLESYQCSKSFVVYGFNYERNVDCMLEDLGHRTESILKYVYGSWEPADNHLWGKFTRYENRNPGEAACGNIHFGPNSLEDYDYWKNTQVVESTCDDWLINFPHLKGTKREISNQDWGGMQTDFDKYNKQISETITRLHHLWWFKRIPHHEGSMDGKLINWWKYVFDWNTNKP